MVSIGAVIYSLLQHQNLLLIVGKYDLTLLYALLDHPNPFPMPHWCMVCHYSSVGEQRCGKHKDAWSYYLWLYSVEIADKNTGTP